MRLTKQQQETIVKAVNEIFGTDAEIWLFGSRVDDSLRGGDIDLYIESGHDDPSERLELENRLFVKLQRALGERRIDIVSRSTAEAMRPIHQQAREYGVHL